MKKDFGRDYDHHAPRTSDERDAHALVRSRFRQLAEEMDAMLPTSRELSVMHTELETAHFWAHAALARSRAGPTT